MNDGGPTPWDDTLYGFHLAHGLVRGRLIRLGSTLDDILGRHADPPAVQTLLAETAVLAAALAGGLKYEGVFTLQTSTDGPISTLMADVTSTGDIRAVARLDPERLDATLAAMDTADPDEPTPPDVFRLLGRGHVAFTVDQGPRTDRYQGITELVGTSLAQSVEHYFLQSEQLSTVVVTAVRRDPAAPEGTGWSGGCLLIQRMPPEAGGRNDAAANDAWETAGVLLRTLGADELLDPALTPDRIVHRLFHAEALVPGETRSLRFGCRCSREKVEAALSRFQRSELEAMKQEDGVVTATCQFCTAHYTFTDTDLDALASDGASPNGSDSA
ncbi:Hsp33 family molecular chaperone HslO [Roseospira marina]|uniref:Hsp33 family molecular chaperone HslO n=1 Tax=Roseospira marina TaxID=140057 RepID=A0A5M6IGX4_9PROT|nr:Hsp33 family molecular chaperone HslO [Roseospira marina]KAA5606925.1 Hsp33 family molecular chaperone HslO [Roseospira marina]MBB4312903.1 molecular chaperone Hsp33 [Roseospira marina]MBB5086324.1 molecular chaperone Hsp33 [Roseospira marina]